MFNYILGLSLFAIMMHNKKKKGFIFDMITKKSSNDEVLHHFRQMELMLLTEQEKSGLKSILSIEDILKIKVVDNWLEDGICPPDWRDDTATLIEEVKNKIKKDYVIKEHLSQCKGFIAYNILLSKLGEGSIEVMYQNGEWVFSVLDDCKERVCWVNQRFNICFFNTSYEKRFFDLLKGNSHFEINKQWILKRESWFYSSDLFEELNVILKKTSFQEISKVNKVLEEEMPPLLNNEDNEILSTVEEISIVKDEIPCVIEQSKIEKELDFSVGVNSDFNAFDKEYLPEINEEEGFDLFKVSKNNTNMEVCAIESEFKVKEQNAFMEIDSNAGTVFNIFEQNDIKVNSRIVATPDNVQSSLKVNKPSFSYTKDENLKVKPKVETLVARPARALFGSNKGKANNLVPAPAIAPKKGFKPLLSNGSNVIGSDIPFGQYNDLDEE